MTQGRDFFFTTLFFHSLGDGKLYPAALTRTDTQTVDASQVFERSILQMYQR